MDLHLLNQPLPVVENPGLETTDPRLEEVSALVQRAQYLEAAAQAEAILLEGIVDIRLIGFLAYGVFLEEGVAGLKGRRIIARLTRHPDDLVVHDTPGIFVHHLCTPGDNEGFIRIEAGLTRSNISGAIMKIDVHNIFSFP